MPQADSFSNTQRLMLDTSVEFMFITSAANVNLKAYEQD